MRLSLGYPTAEDYIDIITANSAGNAIEELTPVCRAEDITKVQKECEAVYIHPDLIRYIATLAEKSRSSEGVLLGLSTRAIISVVQLARACAAAEGRSFVTPEDVKTVFPYAAVHRLILSGGYRHREGYGMNIIKELLASVEAVSYTHLDVYKRQVQSSAWCKLHPEPFYKLAHKLRSGGLGLEYRHSRLPCVKHHFRMRFKPSRNNNTWHFIFKKLSKRLLSELRCKLAQISIFNYTYYLHSLTLKVIEKARKLQGRSCLLYTSRCV